MRIHLAIFSLALVIAACLVPRENSALAATWESDYFPIKVTLPERWIMRKKKDTNYSSWVQFRDREDKAHFYLRAIWLKRELASSLEQWVVRDEIPRRLEGLGSGYTATILAEKETKVILGSGQEAQMVQYDADWNFHRRNVSFVYFKSLSNTRRWFCIFIYNQGGQYDQEESLKTIVAGITLRH